MSRKPTTKKANLTNATRNQTSNPGTSPDAHKKNTRCPRQNTHTATMPIMKKPRVTNGRHLAKVIITQITLITILTILTITLTITIIIMITIWLQSNSNLLTLIPTVFNY